MTLTSETNETPYTSVGTLNENFPTVFTFFDPSDVVVYFDGTLQVLGTNYTISGGLGLAGTVIWVGTPTSGKKVELIRRRPSTQGTKYTENDAFPSKSHEDALDKAMMALNTAIRLKSGAANVFTALSRRISDLATPTLATDAVTKAYADAISAPTVTIPTPGGADDGKHIEALASAYVLTLPAWVTGDLPLAGDTGRVLTATGAGTHAWQALPATVNPPPVQNYIINGQMQISQRVGRDGTQTAATSFNNNDGSYVVDRWCLLSDGNDIVDVTHASATPPPGAKHSMRAIVQTANKKWGYVQFIENERTLQIREDGATTRVSFQFKARTTTGDVVSNLRVAILAWTSTVDQPTKDLVSAWNAAGSDPAFVANYTVENTPANLALVVDTWTTFKIENVLLDASATNLAIFIWVDDDDSEVGDDLFIGDVMLNDGATARDFIRRTEADELLDCQRYMFSTFTADERPRSNAGNDTGEYTFPAIQAGALLNRASIIRLPVRMRAVPAAADIVSYNPEASGIQVRDQTANVDCTALGLTDGGDQSLVLICTGNAATAIGNRLGLHVTVEAELGV